MSRCSVKEALIDLALLAGNEQRSHAEANDSFRRAMTNALNLMLDDIGAVRLKVDAVFDAVQRVTNPFYQPQVEAGEVGEALYCNVCGKKYAANTRGRVSQTCSVSCAKSRKKAIKASRKGPK